MATVSLVRPPLITYHETYRTGPHWEAVFTLPTTSTSDNRSLMICLDACGGGTPGEAYTHTSWVYAIILDGKIIASGHDLHSTGTPATHADMAATLCSFMVAATEDSERIWNGDPHDVADRLDAFVFSVENPGEF